VDPEADVESQRGNTVSGPECLRGWYSGVSGVDTLNTLNLTLKTTQIFRRLALREAHLQPPYCPPNQNRHLSTPGVLLVMPRHVIKVSS
jgi:hypothetical protein